VNGFNGGVVFQSMVGFDPTIIRSADGVYTLKLLNPPPSQFQIIAVATAVDQGACRVMTCAPIAGGQIIVRSYAGDNTLQPPFIPVDGQFMIVVHIAPLFP
jgi:hypothetical protein